jgi:hypothetical protein
MNISYLLCDLCFLLFKNCLMSSPCPPCLRGYPRLKWFNNRSADILQLAESERLWQRDSPRGNVEFWYDGKRVDLGAIHQIVIVPDCEQVLAAGSRS